MACSCFQVWLLLPRSSTCLPKCNEICAEWAIGPVTILHSYLHRAEECMEKVQKMPPQKFNNHQCDYLADKLRVVVESARSFLMVCGAKLCHGPSSSEDMARSVDIFKLLVALAQEIESFIQGCCKDAWIQAAMTLTNVSEYISSLGFNLELCRVAVQSKECATSGILTLDQVADMHKDEVEVVKTKSSTDWDALVAKVIHSLTDKSLSTEENDLAAYLLQRLHRVKPILQSVSSGSCWRSIIDDEGSVLGNLYKWVKPLERLGKGATGTVYRALWLGTPVAKKTFSGRNNADFKREVEILAGLCHPNVTSMFCCAEHMHTCSIIMELMDEDLHELMERRCEQRFDGNSECPPFTILEGVDMMLQVGEGVNYLHHQVTPSIVHRDLKSSNILIKRLSGTELESGYVHAKVTDFGLSKTKDCSKRYSQQTWNTGTTRWMAPELIRFSMESQASTSKDEKVPRYPHKCDVYSFAMVCYEILTGHEPFPNELISTMKEKVLRGKRPDIPDHCPLELKTLIEECWNQDPKNRPSFEVICLKLKYLKYLLMTGFNSKSSGVGCTEFHLNQKKVESQEYLLPFLRHQGFPYLKSQGGEWFRLTGSCSLVLHRGDITKWYKDGKTDAIVNSANERMLGGGGVDGAIHSAAGRGLLKACLKFPEVSKGVVCPVGCAIMTQGFNLPVSHIIHTVGPAYYNEEGPASLLAKAYKSSVNLAVKNGLKFVAFPAISCGLNEYPCEEAAQVSIQALQDSADQLLEVHFVLYQEDTYGTWLWQAEKKLERLSHITLPIVTRVRNLHS